MFAGRVGTRRCVFRACNRHRVGDQLVEAELQRGDSELSGQVLKLAGCRRELLQQHGGEARVVLQQGVGGAPGLSLLEGWQRAVSPGCTHLLKTGETVGQEPQMVALEGRKQSGLDGLHHLPGERTLGITLGSRLNHGQG